MIRKTIACTSAFLSLAALVHAHPGHSAFDAFAGLPQAGHEGEYAVFLLGVLAVLAASIRAWARSRE